MLVEGPNLLSEAIRAGITIETVFAGLEDEWGPRLAREAGAELVEVDEPVLRRLADTKSPRGPVAVAVIPPSVTPRGDLLWLDTGDPGNVGTLIRTAAAFGFGVSLGPRAADPWSPKVLRASAGAVFGVECAVDGSLPADGLVVATVVRDGIDVREAADALDDARPVVVLVGDEAAGLGSEQIEGADLRVTIPMPGGTESLNASIAGAIVAYELGRARNSAGPTRSRR
jgi:TrmH family RNA methyltransferase